MTTAKDCFTVWMQKLIFAWGNNDVEKVMECFSGIVDFCEQMCDEDAQESGGYIGLHRYWSEILATHEDIVIEDFQVYPVCDDKRAFIKVWVAYDVMSLLLKREGVKLLEIQLDENQRCNYYRQWTSFRGTLYTRNNSSKEDVSENLLATDDNTRQLSKI